MVLLKVAKRENTEEKDITQDETIYHYHKSSINSILTRCFLVVNSFITVTYDASNRVSRIDAEGGRKIVLR